MDTNELLKPRWKIIADFPRNDFGKVGTVIDRDWGQYPDDDETKEPVWSISQYPHLFQPIEWYEERQVNEMPEYVKQEHEVIKIIRWLPPVGWMREGEYITAYDWLPATAEEYKSFIAQTEK